jgi:outer membrane protein assembly factor BamB
VGQRVPRARVAAALRVLPLAVLCAIVVAALAARLRTRDAASRAAAGDARATAPSTRPPGASSSPLDAPLRAEPIDGGALDASVPRGAPRMIHGAPTHVHRSAARGPETARVKWRTPVGGGVAAQVTTSPAAPTLYAATLGGSVVALARADGAMRWSAPLGDRVYSTPLVADDGTIYAGTDAKKLVALDPRGTVKWRLDVDGEADTSPAFGGGGTVVFAAGSAVYAARRGGDLAWRFATRGKVFTAPAVTADGTVIVGAQDHRVYAIDPSGALAWSTDLGADVDGAAAIADDGAIFVGTDAGEVVRLDARGTIVWRCSTFGFVRGTLSIARDGDVLAGTYGPVPRVLRITPSGVVRGAFAIQGTGAREFGIHGAPLEDAAGTLFFGAQDDAVYAIARDGTLRFRFETRGDVDAPLTMLTDGSLVIGSEDGLVTMLLP